MPDSISVTIEYEKVEITILGPDFIQVNLLEPVILEDHNAVALNTAHREGDGSDHSDVAANSSRLTEIPAVTDGAKGTGFNNLGTIPDGQDFNASTKSDYSADIAADRTITLSGFTVFTQRMVVRYNGIGGPWVVTLPIGWEVETGSQKDLSSIANGETLDALFKSYDNGATGTVAVREISV